MINEMIAPPGLSSIRSKSHGKNVATNNINSFLKKSIIYSTSFVIKRLHIHGLSTKLPRNLGNTNSIRLLSKRYWSGEWFRLMYWREHSSSMLRFSSHLSHCSEFGKKSSLIIGLSSSFFLLRLSIFTLCYETSQSTCKQSINIVHCALILNVHDLIPDMTINI